MCLELLDCSRPFLGRPTAPVPTNLRCELEEKRTSDSVSDSDRNDLWFAGNGTIIN